MNKRFTRSLQDVVVPSIIAWLALNVVVYSVALVTNISFGTASRFFGSFIFPNAHASLQIWAGRGLFFLAAIGWSYVYAWMYHVLPRNAWLRGMWFGIIIWFFTGLVVPLLAAVQPHNTHMFVPHQLYSFPGLFGFGFAEISGVMMSFAAHIVYGCVLSVVFTRQQNGVSSI